MPRSDAEAGAKTEDGRSRPGERDPGDGVASPWLVTARPDRSPHHSAVGVWPLGRLSSPSDVDPSHIDPVPPRDAEAGAKTEDGRW